MLKYTLLLFILSIIIVHESYANIVDTDIQNRNVDRTIDLTSQLVKISYKITLEHKLNKNINYYVFIIADEDINKLSFISVKDSSKKELKYEKSIEGKMYKINFPGAGSTSQVLYIETVFTKSLQPYPTHITQSERQLVRYFGSAYFLSPYKTVTQKTTIHLSSKIVESFTAVKPSGHSDSTITYGPYDNIAAFSVENIIVHFENQTPFLTVTRLERTIEVSHWGNIAVEETIDMIHSGAILKGSFSRYDYQKDGRNGQASIKSYLTILPAAASEVYYRDTNGNISTSSMRAHKDSIELDLRPRFPLFGGWKTHYTLGYNVPSFEYLFNNGDNYLLKMRVIDHIYDDMIVDELIVRIILPEGAKDMKLITPYGVTRLSDDLHSTYLDTFGRPVIKFSKKNLVENHIHDFNLKYKFPRYLMIQEPLLIVGFLYILFVFVIIWMRLDFSITNEKDVQHHHKD